MPTVLVVDDEEALRQYMARVLEDDGHKVILAANGLEALSLLERPSPRIHLVVSDVYMPLMTGPELAARLAEHHSPPPLLFVSGSQNLLEGVAPLLRKPFRPIDLCETVRLLLLSNPEPARVLEGCGRT